MNIKIGPFLYGYCKLVNLSLEFPLPPDMHVLTKTDYHSAVGPRSQLALYPARFLGSLYVLSPWFSLPLVVSGHMYNGGQLVRAVLN